MKITILRSVEDAGKATGLAIVIDVFRAFTTEAYIFANGAAEILPVENLEVAYKLKEEHPEYILVGEREGRKPEGFDYGNSPTEILHVDFSGKTIIHTTSNGTKGLANAIKAEAVLVGSFVNADSTVEYIKNHHLKDISLISTSPDTKSDNEDILLAEYIKSRLLKIEVNEEEIKEKLRTTSAYAFLLGEAGVPDTDFDLCLDFHRFSFVIRKTIQNNRICLIREHV